MLGNPAPHNSMGFYTEKQIRAEERRFRKIEKMIERKDKKALEREMKKLVGKDKSRKDDWL